MPPWRMILTVTQIQPRFSPVLEHYIKYGFLHVTTTLYRYSLMASIFTQGDIPTVEIIMGKADEHLQSIYRE